MSLYWYKTVSSKYEKPKLSVLPYEVLRHLTDSMDSNYKVEPHLA